MQLYYWDNIEILNILAYANSKEQAIETVLNAWSENSNITDKEEILERLQLELTYNQPKVIDHTTSFSTSGYVIK